MKWWPLVLHVLSISEQQLGKLVRPSTVIGNITENGQELLGLPQDAKVVAGSLDHHLAGIGAGVGQTVDISESTGTVLACVNLTNDYSPKAGVCIGPDIKENQYWQLAWDTNGALGLEWYQQNYAKSLTIEQLTDMAQDIPVGCDGLTAKPMCWTYPDLSGFEGLNDRHGHGHFIRAIMESAAVSLKEITQRLCQTKRPRAIAATGGGAKNKLWLKIKSEIVGAEVTSTECIEPACYGAAILASTAR